MGSLDPYQSVEQHPVRTDGGYATRYVWFDPDTEAVLYHTGVNNDAADPFFTTVEEASRFLEQRADQGDEERYERLSLYRVRMRKEKDALDVLLDQSGLDDFGPFAPDGGQDAALKYRGYGRPAQDDQKVTEDANDPPEQADFNASSSEQTRTEPTEDDG